MVRHLARFDAPWTPDYAHLREQNCILM